MQLLLLRLGKLPRIFASGRLSFAPSPLPPPPVPRRTRINFSFHPDTIPVPFDPPIASIAMIKESLSENIFFSTWAFADSEPQHLFSPEWTFFQKYSVISSYNGHKAKTPHQSFSLRSLSMLLPLPPFSTAYHRSSQFCPFLSYTFLSSHLTFFPKAKRPAPLCVRKNGPHHRSPLCPAAPSPIALATRAASGDPPLFPSFLSCLSLLAPASAAWQCRLETFS